MNIHKMAGYASHLPVLTACVAHTEGPIIELGCGAYSTPVLHALCAESGRRLVSYETDAEWFAAFKKYHRGSHEMNLVTSWDDAPVAGEWAVALVDHAPPSRRVVEVGRLRHAQVVVCHDTEHRLYRYETILPTFKARVEDRRQSPWTTAVSDVDDLKWLKDTLLS